jgi:carbon-monoxide dehydrogenase medium subunit
VITHPFSLFVPGSLDEALAIASQLGGDVSPLAGGTVLVPEMNRGAMRPGVVLDLSRCGLAGVSEGLIGALATYRQLAALPGLVGKVARGITGGAQIRNRATAGGSACCANPSSDVPALLVALRATLVVRSAAKGERRVPSESFFVDAFQTALLPGELLVSIELPALDPGSRAGYAKLKFGESSWPIVTALAVLGPRGRARVVLGGAAAVPLAVEVGTAEEAAQAVSEALADPWSDVLASADYRRKVAPVMARRAMEAA